LQWALTVIPVMRCRPPRSLLSTTQRTAWNKKPPPG
jgi:hypothetical protein